MDKTEAFERAREVFEVLPGAERLTAAVAVLARADVAKRTIRGFVRSQANAFGLPIDEDQLGRIVARGIEIAAGEAAEPEAVDGGERVPEVEDLPRFAVPARAEVAIPEAAVFGDVRTLLTVITSAGAVKKRLRDLQDAIVQVTDGQEQLAKDRAAFDRHVAEVEARLEAQQAQLLAIYRRVSEEKAELERFRADVRELHQHKQEAASRRYIHHQSGLVQERDDAPRERDPIDDPLAETMRLA